MPIPTSYVSRNSHCNPLVTSLKKSIMQESGFTDSTCRRTKRSMTSCSKVGMASTFRSAISIQDPKLFYTSTNDRNRKYTESSLAVQVTYLWRSQLQFHHQEAHQQQGGPVESFLFHDLSQVSQKPHMSNLLCVTTDC